VANTGGAISQGAELTFQVRPWNRTSVAGWYAYTDAKLAQDFPANSQAIGRKGDSLPFSSRHSANLSIDHELYTRGDMRLSVGTTVVYVGDRKDVFLSTFDIGTNRFELPSYTQVDARASLSFGSSWKTDFYVKNATDERGSLQGNAADVARGSPVGVIYIQPRTVGVSLNKRF
jgi:outer membrane receptor protein involved in Fe transport